MLVSQAHFTCIQKGEGQVFLWLCKTCVCVSVYDIMWGYMCVCKAKLYVLYIMCEHIKVLHLNI